MEKEVEINYTENARIRIEKLKNDYIKKMEDIIKERKYVPGEKIIEITASDLEQASVYLKFIKPRRNASLKNVLALYVFFGVIMILWGLFYPLLIKMFEESPERLMITLGGITLTFMGLFLYWRIKKKETQAEKKDYIEDFIKDYVHYDNEKLRGYVGVKPKRND